VKYQRKTAKKNLKRNQKSDISTGICCFCAGCTFFLLIFFLIVFIILAIFLYSFYINDGGDIQEFIKKLTTTESSSCGNILQPSINIAWVNQLIILDEYEKEIRMNKQNKQAEVCRSKPTEMNDSDHKDIEEIDMTKNQGNDNSSSQPRFRHYGLKVAPITQLFLNYSERLKTVKKGYMIAIGEPFLVFEGGYQVIMSLCPSGCNDGEGTHLSVYAHLMKGPYDDELEQAGRWPFSGVFIIELLNQFSDNCHFKTFLLMDKNVCGNCATRVEVEDMLGQAYGICQFYLLSNLENTYLQNNSLYFRISYQRYISSFILAESIETVYLVKISIYNWITVSVLLLLIEFIAFSLNESVLMPSGKVGLDIVERFLLIKWKVIVYTIRNIFCRTLRNFIIIITIMISAYVVLFILELMYSNMSSFEDKAKIICTVVKRIGEVVIWSMAVETYKTSWGRSLMMIGPMWIIHLFMIDLYEVMNFMYKVYLTQKLLFNIVIVLYSFLALHIFCTVFVNVVRKALLHRK